MRRNAYDRLRTTKPDLLAAFEAVVEEDVPSASSPEQMLSIAVAKKIDSMLSKQWTIKFMNHRIKVRDQVQRIVRVAETVKQFGSAITQIDPVHAGLPLAGVNVLLTVSHHLIGSGSGVFVRIHMAREVPKLFELWKSSIVHLSVLDLISKTYALWKPRSYVTLP